MSYISFNNDGILFHDDTDKPQKLIELFNPAANQSDLSQADLVDAVQGNLQRLLSGTFQDAADAIIFLRLAAELIRKPQIHNVLHIGQWSTLDEILTTILPKFNPKNFLWSYAPSRPVRKFEHVNFIFAEMTWGGHMNLFPLTNSTR